jgi:DEAD/DEAH box helicase domain-containing protein
MDRITGDTDALTQIAEYLEGSGLVTCSWTLSAQFPVFGDYPAGLEKSLSNLLQSMFSQGLYNHQTEAINAILRGENVLITTGTSSGKSLCYQIPCLNAAIRDPQATSILLFPTKALAFDQLKKLQQLIPSISKDAGKKIAFSTYDGDTPRGQRLTIRNTVRILLSNPDMLHLGLLPQHTNWERFFVNLKYIVIDEVHTYRGVFGSHFANVLRRLKRILVFYKCQPQFILTSATISNAMDFASNLTGEKFWNVDTDTSYQESRQYFFINPPVVDESLGLRKGLIDQSLEIARFISRTHAQSILFSRTRKTVEITLKRLRETSNLGEQSAHGYRSGYLPKERREIEQGLRSGEISSVVSTSALEMGIDMGKVDLTLLMGYPGSISSFYQQSGRAGRRDRQSISVMVASASPMDQYVIRHCEFVSKGKPEHALIDPNNPLILLEHLKCAAFELPITTNEHYGDLSREYFLSYLNAMVALKHLIIRNNTFYWIAEDYPSSKISLRNISGNPVALRVREGLKSHLIGEVDFQSAQRFAHPGAVYLHDGSQYLVDELDLESSIAWMSPHNGTFFTEHRSETSITVENIILEEKGAHRIKSFGELLVTEKVKGYKRIDWETLLTVGEYELEGLPQNELHTKGLWLTIPDHIVEVLRKKGNWRNDQNNYGPKWQEIRNSVLLRDSNCCQVCGIKLPSPQMHVHHKIPFRTFNDADSANQRENLVTLCPGCHRKVEQNVRVRSGLSGLGYLIANLAPLKLMCDTRDIEYFCEADSNMAGGKPVIAIYDQFPGGIGLSAKLYELVDDTLEQCLQTINQCGCEEGCPSCVGPAGENGFGGKEYAREILNSILRQYE